LALNLLALKALIFLASQNGFTGMVRISTPNLARVLGTSQQSASRILIRLEKEQLIERRNVGRIGYARITSKGYRQLVDLYSDLRLVVERPLDFVIEGKVFSGLGEGAYYVSLPGYRQQFREKLGFDPYPGTLNVRLLTVDVITNRRLLEKLADVRIEGFRNGARTFGGLKAITGTFNDSELCAILFIERSHYGEDVIEVISPVYLRGKYGLRDGDKVRVRVTLPRERVSQERVDEEGAAAISANG
jgi:riboflavin kinase